MLLFWRRRAPVTVAALAIVLAAAAPLAGGAALVGVFTAAASVPGRAPLVLGVLAAAAGAFSAIVFPDESVSRVVGVLFGLVFVAAAAGWGLAVRGRREHLAALTERAERVEAEQQARLDAARRAERAAIAAEMHDVLAHRLSMLSIHAGAIELHPDAPPADLVKAAGIVRTSAHQAIEELRQVMGILRDDLPSMSASPLAPVPTIADVEPLVAECRAAGMRVELTMRTDGAAVPADVGRHAYRIVQEGLTNARKHASGADVGVVVDGAPGRGLSIEIRNALRPTAGGSAVPGTGLGLAGLRERVALLRGTLSAGPAGDIHLLRVWLPWTP